MKRLDARESEKERERERGALRHQDAFSFRFQCSYKTTIITGLGRMRKYPVQRFLNQPRIDGERAREKERGEERERERERQGIWRFRARLTGEHYGAGSASLFLAAVAELARLHSRY